MITRNEGGGASLNSELQGREGKIVKKKKTEEGSCAVLANAKAGIHSQIMR